MPALRDLLDLILRAAEQSGHGFEADFMQTVERQIRQAYGGDRIYINPPTSREQQGRADKIAALSRTLPTAVVAERVGVSRSYVRRVMRRG